MERTMMTPTMAPPTVTTASPVAAPRVTIATSYNESSVHNLARAAGAAGLLDSLITPEAPPPAVRRWLEKAPPAHTRKVPGVGRVAGVIGGRASSVPGGQAVRSRLFAANLVRLAVWRAGLRGPLPDGVLTLLFDAAVARDLHRRGSQRVGLLVGMPCSSLRAFLKARERGMLTAYNHVNCNLHGLNSAVHEAAARLGIRPASPWPGWLVRRVDREVEAADYVLVSSTFLRDDLAARGVPAGKLVVLPDGVDSRRFAPPREARRREPGEGLRVLFSGVVSVAKGLQDLDAAVALCGEDVASCVAIGGTVDRALPDRTPRIAYRGMVAHEEIVAAMRDADVFVLPSLGDTMPRVVMEALACGLPVVTTRESGCDHVIRDGENGFIVPAGDPAAIAMVLRRLAADPDAARAIGRAARRTAEAFTWERHADAFLAWLASLPAPGGAPATQPAAQSGRTRRRR